mgnify:CR=1 FL=1
MVYRFFRTEEARGFQYGYHDLMVLKCVGDSDLGRFHKAIKAVRIKLPHNMDVELIKLFYYDQVKSLSQLREIMYHYELADEGSSGKTLDVLTSAVEKLLDRKQRESNRRAQEKVGAVPGMARYGQLRPSYGPGTAQLWPSSVSYTHLTLPTKA